MPDLVGKRISHYEISAKIGEGGMGVVYLAEDTRLRRRVALKFVSPQLIGSTAEKARLIREARAAAGLDHPSICTIHEVDQAEGYTFIAMAHIEGRPLRALIPAEGLPLAESLELAVQLAEGLVEAHRKGVVHRDIKPANLMVTAQGRLKITDFGLAKLMHSQPITRRGVRMGTAAYMSPEQVRGEAVDHRTDIWSLGVVLYEMITGRLPFAGENEPALLYALCHRPPVPIAERCGDVPPGLSILVMRCLQKDPAQRYAEMRDLLADLRRLQRGWDTQSILAPVALARAPLVRGRRTRVLAVSGLVAVLLITAGLLAGPTLQHWLGGGAGALPAERHLAVLPLINIGGGAREQAFCDGLVEVLSSKLTQLEERAGRLWVVPASEMRRSGISSADAARREFGVRLAVSGSVLRDSQQVTVTLNLVDTVSLRQLRSAVLAMGTSEMAMLQESAVAQVAAMLDLDVSPQRLAALSSGQTSVARVSALYLEGLGYLRRYEQRDNVARAIELFEEALTGDPGYALAAAALGQAEWRMYEHTHDTERVARATAACGRALGLSDELAATYITLGMIHSGTGHAAEAVGDFERALQREPLNSDAHRELAGAYELQGLFAEAEAAYQRTIELRPSCWAGYNNLGRFYFHRGRYEDAATQFLRLISLTPDNARGYSSLGGTYILLERWDEAREMFERSLEIEPTYIAYTNLGALCFQQERFTAAAEAFEHAVAYEDQADHRAWGNLGGAYDRLGRTAEARAAFEQALQLADEQRRVNPRDPSLPCLTAVYLEMLGGDAVAREMLEECLRLEPRDLETWFQAAHTFEKIGDRERALFCLSEALSRGYPIAKVERAGALEALRADTRYTELRMRFAGSR